MQMHIYTGIQISVKDNDNLHLLKITCMIGNGYCENITGYFSVQQRRQVKRSLILSSTLHFPTPIFLLLSFSSWNWWIEDNDIYETFSAQGRLRLLPCSVSLLFSFFKKLTTYDIPLFLIETQLTANMCVQQEKCTMFCFVLFCVCTL